MKHPRTLILCSTEAQRQTLINALDIPARIELIGSALTGARFEKIIVFRKGLETPMEKSVIDRIIAEDLPTKLAVGHLGEIYVL